jgi:hypothetical protein
MGTSALTLPTMAMSKASINTPAMITIRIELSIAFSTAGQGGAPWYVSPDISDGCRATNRDLRCLH